MTSPRFRGRLTSNRPHFFRATFLAGVGDVVSTLSKHCRGNYLDAHFFVASRADLVVHHNVRGGSKFVVALRIRIEGHVGHLSRERARIPVTGSGRELRSQGVAATLA
jgi:hypothetical protein